MYVLFERILPMIIILDMQRGEVYHFTTRKKAAGFLKVSAPTLRAWLKFPFYLYRFLLIILTSDERAKQTDRLINVELTNYKHRPNGSDTDNFNRVASGDRDNIPRMEVSREGTL
jgi:hypothetical protein